MTKPIASAAAPSAPTMRRTFKTLPLARGASEDGSRLINASLISRLHELTLQYSLGATVRGAIRSSG